MRVVIVDDGELGELSNSLPECVVLRSPRRGPAAARNCGARSLSDVEYLLFIDDDCVLGRDFVDTLVLAIEQTAADVVVPSVAPYGNTGEGLLGEYLVRRGFQMPYVDFENGVACLPTAALAVRRTLFNAVGGFPEEITWAGGEDDVFATRTLQQHARVYFSSDSIVFHENPTRLGELLRRWYRYGRGHAAVVALLDLPPRVYGLPPPPVSRLSFMRTLTSRLLFFTQQARVRKEFPMGIRAAYLLLDAMLEVSRQFGAWNRQSELQGSGGKFPGSDSDGVESV